MIAAYTRSPFTMTTVACRNCRPGDLRNSKFLRENPSLRARKAKHFVIKFISICTLRCSFFFWSLHPRWAHHINQFHSTLDVEHNFNAFQSMIDSILIHHQFIIFSIVQKFLLSPFKRRLRTNFELVFRFLFFFLVTKLFLLLTNFVFFTRRSSQILLLWL